MEVCPKNEMESVAVKLTNSYRLPSDGTIVFKLRQTRIKMMGRLWVFRYHLKDNIQMQLFSRIWIRDVGALSARNNPNILLTLLGTRYNFHFQIPFVSRKIQIYLNTGRANYYYDYC